MTIARRKALHHDYFKNENIQWKLFQYWCKVGWENMKMEMIEDNIENKIIRRQKENQYIENINIENRINTIKAIVRNH